MAKSGRINGTPTGSNASTYNVWAEWKRNGDPDIANNRSNVTVDFYVQRNITTAGAYNLNTVNPVKLTVDGTVRVDKNIAIDTRGGRLMKLASWTGNITHDGDGKKTFTISGSFSIVGTSSLSGGSVSGTATLNTIPRESKITSFTLTDRTCTQFKINYKVDKPVNRVRYRINSGSWTTLPSNGIITGRSPNTTYRVQIEVRNTASGLTTTSSTKSITTYRLSTYTVPSRNTGQSITVAINRATSNLTHDVTLQYLSSTGSWINWITLTNQGTSAVFNPTTTQLNTLYNARPDTARPSIRVSVVNKWANSTTQGSNVSNSAILTIVDANPSIASVSYADVNSTIQAILNNDQKILRNKSDLRVTSGQVTSQKGATLKYLTVSIGGKDTRVNISGTSVSDININVGKINQSSNQTATITVTDSRGYTATRSFTVQVLNYQEPQITYADAERLNNYEEPTTLKITARRAIVKPDSTDVNTVEIRYRVKENPSGSYGSWINVNPVNASTSGVWQNFNVSQYMADYPNDKSYTVEIQMQDKFTVWKSTAIALTKGIALMSFKQDKIEVGVPIETSQDIVINSESVSAHMANYASLFTDNPDAKNSIYRGKYLGNSVTSQQYTAISSGTFTDLYIGDYWTINGINWRIAAFNYYRNTGDSLVPGNHITIVPDTNLYTHGMNDTNITTGGYTGSKMYTTGLGQAKTTIKGIFGAHLIKHRQILSNATVDGKASGWAWIDSEVELMSEPMVYGSIIWGESSVGGSGYNIGVGKSQLPLFRLNPRMINTRQSYWLRDVVSAAYFAIVRNSGFANYYNASNAIGVRPAFSIS